jgi:hypothetical protein
VCACACARMCACVLVWYVCVCARAYVCECVRVFKYLILFQGHSADVQPGPYYYFSLGGGYSYTNARIYMQNVYPQTHVFTCKTYNVHKRTYLHAQTHVFTCKTYNPPLFFGLCLRVVCLRHATVFLVECVLMCVLSVCLTLCYR